MILKRFWVFFITSAIEQSKECFIHLLIHFPSKTVTEPLEISDLVRELRQRLELTQEQFASELGVTFTTINRWENRHSKPSKMAMMLIEKKVRELGENGTDLLQYFSSKSIRLGKDR